MSLFDSHLDAELQMIDERMVSDAAELQRLYENWVFSLVDVMSVQSVEEWESAGLSIKTLQRLLHWARTAKSPQQARRQRLCAMDNLLAVSFERI
mmetsp:Transcript_34522/g.86717  ORF Transcript_34522/g.86717 Transcript_34522/m.86717 type:complete len:95 (+) Transcript_34522:92-376(+)